MVIITDKKCSSYFSPVSTKKLELITAIDDGFRSPRDIVPSFASVYSVITKSLMTDFDLGSSIPSGKVLLLQSEAYFSFVP